VAHTVCHVIVGFTLVSAVVAAYDPAIDELEALEAIRIGQSRVESERLRFQQQYRFIVNRPPVDVVEIVTPFRRIVQAAERRALVAGGLFMQSEALAIAAASAGQLDVVVETTFHPLNTFVAVPAYEVRMVAPANRSPVGPSAVERIPRYTLGSEKPGVGQPLAGGTITATFDAIALSASGMYDVVVSEAGKELARARVDLARIR
jgi:hypothetical protein